MNPKNYEYNEGPMAGENFEEGMKALFQVPKDTGKKKKKPAKKRAKKAKTTGCDVSRDSGGEA